MSNGAPTHPPGDVPVDIPRPVTCDSPECVAALAEVVRTRAVIIFKCGQVASARARTNAMAAIAGALFTLAIGAFAAAGAASATIFGIPLAAVLFWIAVTLLATAILFAIFAAIGFAQIAVLEGELNRARSDFINATDAVTKACPVMCWGDLTMPSC